MFILDSNKYARDRQTLPAEINGMIEAAGGEIELSRMWEERRLAYPVKGQRKGTYWIAYFRLTTTKLTELSRACELHDSVLRQLFVRLPDKLAEAILDHAKGTQTAEEPEAVEEESEQPVEVAAS
jgi:small subunit ribosomal protein S6